MTEKTRVDILMYFLPGFSLSFKKIEKVGLMLHVYILWCQFSTYYYLWTFLHVTVFKE